MQHAVKKMFMFHYLGTISAQMEDPCTCQSVADFLGSAYKNDVLLGLMGRLIMGA